MPRESIAGRARTFLALLACVTCLAGAAPAFAGGGAAYDLEVGLFAGMASPDSYEPLNPDGGGLYGFRLGFSITDAWSVEGSYQVAGLDGEYLGTRTDVDLSAIRFNALYNFRPGQPFRWFLTFGVGEEMVDADDVPMHEVDLGFNAGAGVRFYLGETKRFCLLGTGRAVFTNPGGGVQGSQTNVEATGGVSWSFGVGY